MRSAVDALEDAVVLAVADNVVETDIDGVRLPRVQIDRSGGEPHPVGDGGPVRRRPRQDPALPDPAAGRGHVDGVRAACADPNPSPPPPPVPSLRLPTDHPPP